MFDDLPLFRNFDPITSVKGAADVKLRRVSQAMQLLACYEYADLTDEQAGNMSGLADRPKCCYWKRCSELRSAGFIIDTQQTRESSAGSQMMVCAITEEGREMLRSL